MGFWSIGGLVSIFKITMDFPWFSYIFPQQNMPPASFQSRIMEKKLTKIGSWIPFFFVGYFLLLPTNRSDWFWYFGYGVLWAPPSPFASVFLRQDANQGHWSAICSQGNSNGDGILGVLRHVRQRHVMWDKGGTLPWLQINKNMWMFPKIVGFPPKSSILIGFSIINHPFWGTPIFGNIHVGVLQKNRRVAFFAFSNKIFLRSPCEICWFAQGCYCSLSSQ